MGQDEALAIKVDDAVRTRLQDDWRGSTIKTKRVMLAIKAALDKDDEDLAAQTMAVVRAQHEY